jgi:hypothetical protein
MTKAATARKKLQPHISTRMISFKLFEGQMPKYLLHECGDNVVLIFARAGGIGVCALAEGTVAEIRKAGSEVEVEAMFCIGMATLVILLLIVNSDILASVDIIVVGCDRR